MTDPRSRPVSGSRWKRTSRLWRATVPVVVTPRVTAVTGSLFYLTGAVIAVLVALTHQPHGAAAGMEWGIAAAASVGGIVVAVEGSRMPRWSLHLMNVVGTSLVAVLVLAAAGGEGSEVLAVMFVYVPLDSYFFFPVGIASIYELYGTACICLLAVAGYIPGEEAVALVLVNSVVAVIVVWLGFTAATAETDPLTGLPNQGGLRRLVREALAQPRGADVKTSIGFFEVDGFESIESRFGLRYGDELLQRIGRRLAEAAPAGSTVARYFDEGFAVLLPGFDASQALTVCRDLMGSIVEGHTLSGGITEADSTDTVSLLIIRARSALYEAKQAGRGRLCVHRSDHAETAELEAALAAGQMTVLYQPIVSLPEGTLLGAEALVRWDHPVRGRLAPDGFIPLAEKSELIGDLGRYVISTACREAASWPSCLKVTVNASIRELNRPDYSRMVGAILERSGLEPSRLVVEVTETMMEADSAQMLRNLVDLRAMGVRIALDDFGTGYSSLSRLDRLPIDILKLDRSFVADLADDVREVPMVAAVCALASASRLRVVAEGIETAHQAAVLSAHGCHEGQGYHFGRPGPPAELLAVPVGERVSVVADPA